MGEIELYPKLNLLNMMIMGRVINRYESLTRMVKCVLCLYVIVNCEFQKGGKRKLNV